VIWYFRAPREMRHAHNRRVRPVRIVKWQVRSVADYRALGHTAAMKLVVCALFVAAFPCARSDADAQTRHIDRAPEITQSIELRSRHNVPTPEGEPVIYVDSISVHHTRDEESAVATRDAAGHWHVSVVIEEGPGLLKVEQRLISNDARTLSDAEGRQLDELLRHADLYRESPERPEASAVGAMFHTMEIDTSAGHTVIRWTGRLRGKAGTIADLVIGPG
jgi:hypothetical protein